MILQDSKWRGEVKLPSGAIPCGAESDAGTEN